MNVKVPLLATATVVGSTATVPRSAVGQMTLSGDEVTVGRMTGGLTWTRSAAVKLAGPADPGGVAGMTSSKLPAPEVSTTSISVLVAPSSTQPEFRQVRSVDDGAATVQPGAMDRMTMMSGGGAAAAVKMNVSVTGCEPTAVLGEDETVSVPEPPPDTAPDPAAETAGQARPAAPATATATAPTPHHRRDRHMPAPTRERHVPPSRRGRPDR